MKNKKKNKEMAIVCERESDRIEMRTEAYVKTIGPKEERLLDR
ncbi:hypothetical protein TIFTF001_027049 [Ficus carica]|uniref:Uncharacterized protein n=1 Tax=Ficus carica TaxID=3494 RepID=A0AA88DMM2_FICCA|nr:hypothetical protein TIFTF001_027049 [Ficus carica]